MTKTITVCSLCKSVVDTTGKHTGDTTGKVEFIEPDYKRAYYILARLVAQAYENTDENPEAVEDYVKRAMEFVESMDNAPLTQKV